MEHIASRESLKNTTERLLTAAATLDDAGLAALGADLTAVGGLLHREGSLRRTLSESTTAEQTRVSIMDRLLGGKIGEAAQAVVQHALRTHWSSGADLRDAMDQLGRTAMFLRAERDGQLDEVEDQLFRFGRIVDASPELSVLLDDPTTPGAERAALVGRLLDGRAHPLTIALLTALAQEPGRRSFTFGVGELVDQAAQRRDKVVAVVETAVELTPDQRSRLIAGLSRVYGRGVVAHIVVEPSLAGGVRVRVGDELIDGSVAGRLAALRHRLVG